MSLAAMMWALNEAPIEANASHCRNRLVLVSLANRYNDDTRVAWPSVATIAEELNLSRPTVIKALNALEESGLIARAGTHFVSHIKAQYRPTVWTLNLGKKRPKKDVKPDNGVSDVLNPQESSGKDTLTSTGKDPFTSTGKHTLTSRGKHPFTQTQSRTQRGNQTEPKLMLISDEKSDNASLPLEGINAPENDTPSSQKKTGAGKYPEDFLEWYAIYPRKKAKGDALKAYKAARKEVDHEVLMEKTRKFVVFVEQSQQEQQYIPYPASWLRASRWEDEEETPPAPPGYHTDVRKPSARDKSAEQLMREQWAREDAQLNNNNQPQTEVFEWPYGVSKEIEQ